MHHNDLRTGSRQHPSWIVLLVVAAVFLPVMLASHGAAFDVEPVFGDGRIDEAIDQAALTVEGRVFDPGGPDSWASVDLRPPGKVVVSVPMNLSGATVGDELTAEIGKLDDLTYARLPGTRVQPLGWITLWLRRTESGRIGGLVLLLMAWWTWGLRNRLQRPPQAWAACAAGVICLMLAWGCHGLHRAAADLNAVGFTDDDWLDQQATRKVGQVRSSEPYLFGSLQQVEVSWTHLQRPLTNRQILVLQPRLSPGSEVQLDTHWAMLPPHNVFRYAARVHGTRRNAAEPLVFGAQLMAAPLSMWWVGCGAGLFVMGLWHRDGRTQRTKGTGRHQDYELGVIKRDRTNDST